MCNAMPCVRIARLLVRVCAFTGPITITPVHGDPVGPGRARARLPRPISCRRCETVRNAHELRFDQRARARMHVRARARLLRRGR